jgi:hypothetical protein
MQAWCVARDVRWQAGSEERWALVMEAIKDECGRGEDRVGKTISQAQCKRLLASLVSVRTFLLWWTHCSGVGDCSAVICCRCWCV